MKFLEVFQVIFASQIIAVFSTTIILDRSRDLDKTSWTIEGDETYFNKTDNLRQPKGYKFLPDGFKFEKLGSSRGIWAIFPKDKHTCSWMDDDDDWYSDSSKDKKDSCDRSASAHFTIKTSPQSIEEIKVKYIFGGDNATLRVMSGQEELRELKSNGENIEEWAELSTEVHRKTMTLEANVGGKGDYILIDVISVFIPEVKTTSTTTEPSEDEEDEEPRIQPKTTKSSTTTVEPSHKHDDQNPAGHSTTRSTTTPKTSTTSGPTKHPEPAPVSGQQGMRDMVPLIFIAVLIIIQTSL